MCNGQQIIGGRVIIIKPTLSFELKRAFQSHSSVQRRITHRLVHAPWPQGNPSTCVFTSFPVDARRILAAKPPPLAVALLLILIINLSTDPPMAQLQDAFNKHGTQLGNRLLVERRDTGTVERRLLPQHARA